MQQIRLKMLAPLALSLSIAAAALAFTATPSSAAPMRSIAPDATLQQALQNEAVQEVQWRRRGHYHHRHRGGRGGAVAAGVIGGLALGAMLGAATAAPPPPPPGYYSGGGDWYAYCASKYRSFDPASGTYMGYDGIRRPCQ